MVIEVQVQPHDPEWSGRFMKEAQNLRVLWGSNLVAAHHIGSTTIPWLAADHPHDAQACMDEKAPFIREVEAQAIPWARTTGRPGASTRGAI